MKLNRVNKSKKIEGNIMRRSMAPLLSATMVKEHPLVE